MRSSIPLLRGCAASLTLALFACGGDGPVEPRRMPVAIALVSGNNQGGKAGEQLPEPFEVRVTDAQGEGVEGVKVTWRVTSGAGEFFDAPSSLSTHTRHDGILGKLFIPAVLGTNTVAAEVAGLQGSPVTFTTDVIVLVIDFFETCPFGCSWFFSGPDDSSDVTVPVGTPVEWVCWPGCRIASISAPPDGEPFDSGILDPGGRFRFVPGVAGTWEFEDQISGVTGTLTAQ